MTLTIPDDALAGFRLTTEQVLLEIAIGLYVDSRVTLARGARLAGLPHLQFQRELGRRHIPMHYEIADYDRDLQTLRETGAHAFQ